ncbi:MAG: outer membrane protein assembly factor BamE [Betaproteobacteria bacterium]|nr:outer membrane protein assembly factor BamE [Pseudomonadota bacterium]
MKFSRNLFLPSLAPVALGLLAGCSSLGIPDVPMPSFIKPYRMEIQQGNYVNQEMLSQLRPGMTRDQVKFVMGSPLLVDMFHSNRWEYIFQRQLEFNKGFEQRNLSVFFENDRLLRIQGDVVPAPSVPAVEARPQAVPDPSGVVVTPVIPQSTPETREAAPK